MNVKSDCFIYYADRDSAEATIAQLRMYNGGGRIYLLADNAKMPPIDGCTTIIVDNINSSMAVREIARAAQTDFLFVYSKATPCIGWLILLCLLRWTWSMLITIQLKAVRW